MLKIFLALLLFPWILAYTNVMQNSTDTLTGIENKPEKPFAAVVNNDIEMIRIPAGRFTMGSPATEKDRGGDEVQHEVNLTEFYISKYEVTVGQFKEFIDASGYKTDAEQNNDAHNWRHGSGGNVFDVNDYNYPVIYVSWNDAVAYAAWLAGKTGKRYQLPTEAQWEYAARGGQNYVYAGSDTLDVVGWYGKNSGWRSHPVGQKRPNGYGLYDMTGNVWEWCQDWYAPYPESPVSNPTGPSTGTEHVMRGGSWFNELRDSRVAFRDFNIPARRYYFIGFRVALLP